ncbi:hypothetical protein BDP67DRAFT_530649 [Colletotrichum lupini]|nr:hypothetical protein BDP67DRAFT_530649 [Colletotrichum lupini]
MRALSERPMIKRICRAMIHPQHEQVPQHGSLSFLLIWQYQGKRVKSPNIQNCLPPPVQTPVRGTGPPSARPPWPTTLPSGDTSMTLPFH